MIRSSLALCNPDIQTRAIGRICNLVTNHAYIFLTLLIMSHSPQIGMTFRLFHMLKIEPVVLCVEAAILHL